MSLIIEVLTIRAPTEQGGNATTGRTGFKQRNGFADFIGLEPILNRNLEKHTNNHNCIFDTFLLQKDQIILFSSNNLV